MVGVLVVRGGLEDLGLGEHGGDGVLSSWATLEMKSPGRERRRGAAEHGADGARTARPISSLPAGSSREGSRRSGEMAETSSVTRSRARGDAARDDPARGGRAEDADEEPRRAMRAHDHHGDLIDEPEKAPRSEW